MGPPSPKKNKPKNAVKSPTKRKTKVRAKSWSDEATTKLIDFVEANAVLWSVEIKEYLTGKDKRNDLWVDSSVSFQLREFCNISTQITARAFDNSALYFSHEQNNSNRNNSSMATLHNIFIQTNLIVRTSRSVVLMGRAWQFIFLMRGPTISRSLSKSIFGIRRYCWWYSGSVCNCCTRHANSPFNFRSLLISLTPQLRSFRRREESRRRWCFISRVLLRMRSSLIFNTSNKALLSSIVQVIENKIYDSALRWKIFSSILKIRILSIIICILAPVTSGTCTPYEYSILHTCIQQLAIQYIHIILHEIRRNWFILGWLSSANCVMADITTLLYLTSSCEMPDRFLRFSSFTKYLILEGQWWLLVFRKYLW